MDALEEDFEELTFDITSYNGNYPPDNRAVDCGCQNSCDRSCAEFCGYQKWTQKLTLTRDEAVVETETLTVAMCCGGEIARTQSSDKQERPYAQLGSVDLQMSVNPCNCCAICWPVTSPWQVWSVSTNGINIYPGWGSDETLVRQIASELQARKVSRGNIKLIQLNELMGYELDVVSSWVDVMMEKQGAEADSIHIEAQKIRAFEVRGAASGFKNALLLCFWSFESRIHEF